MNAGPVLVLLAFVLAVLAAIRVPSLPRVDFGWLAVALWLASLLVGYGRLL